MAKITEKQADHILTCADIEGFDYCFREYSSFKSLWINFWLDNNQHCYELIAKNYRA